jgi:hypothetical protein
MNDASDVNKSGFYFCDVNEPAFGIGFMRLWYGGDALGDWGSAVTVPRPPSFRTNTWP